MKRIFFFSLLLLNASLLGARNWVKEWGGIKDDQAKVVSFDHDGNMVVTGTFQGTLEFNHKWKLKARGKSDLFLAKLTPHGEVIWALAGGENLSSNTIPVGLFCSGDGSVYLAGKFYGFMNIKGITLQNREDDSGSSDSFLLKFTSNGNLEWAKTFQGLGPDYIATLAGSDEGLVVGGEFSDDMEYQGVGFTSDYPALPSGKMNGFIMGLSLDGEFLWGKKVNASRSICRNLCFDTEKSLLAICDISILEVGSPFLTDEEHGLQGLVPLKKPLGTKSDVYLMKFNFQTGDLLWVNRLGGTDIDMGYGLTCDSENNAYVGGLFRGESKFDSQVSSSFSKISSNGSYDMFMAKYSSEGELVWAKGEGTSVSESIWELEVTSDNQVLALGNFQGKELPIDNMVFRKSYDGTGGVILAFTSDGTLLKGVTAESKYPSKDSFRSRASFSDIAVSPNGNWLGVVGDFRGEGRFFNKEEFSAGSGKQMWVGLLFKDLATDIFEPESEINQFYVVLNPVRSQFFLHGYEREEPLSIQVYNGLGALCRTFTYLGGVVSTAGWTPGVYYLKVKDSKGIRILKIIHQ